MTVVKKAPDIAIKTTQELIPSLKPVYDRYKSGDVLKSAFGSEHGVMSSKFWRRPIAAEENAKGIIRKGGVLNYSLRLTGMVKNSDNIKQNSLKKTQKHW